MPFMLPYIKAKYALLNFLYPRDLACTICGEEGVSLLSGACTHCHESLPVSPMPRHDVRSIHSICAPFSYDEPIRRLVHDFKYNNKRYLAHFFAQAMLSHLPDCDLICPVPLHPSRKRQRGYSQTNRLCEALMIRHAPPVSLGTLARVRDTPSQTKLDRDQRKANMQNAFRIRENVQNKTICLIDDVATTGTTLHECAKILLRAGAQRIDACVIAF